MKKIIFFSFLSLCLFANESSKVDINLLTINNLFIIFCACLVFIMHLGFTCLETGLTRAKNSISILFKNFSIFPIAILVYFFVGFNLMYPGEFLKGNFLGFGGFGLTSPANPLKYRYWLYLLDRFYFSSYVCCRRHLYSFWSCL